MYERIANRIFYLTLAGAASLLVFTSWFLGQLLPTSYLAWQTVFRPVEVICGCDVVLSFNRHPIVFTGYLVALLVAAAGAIFVVVVVVQNIIRTRRYIKTNISNGSMVLPAKLKRAMIQADCRSRVMVARSDRPIVFCYGMWRPAICISERAVRLLRSRELTIVLRHEVAHCRDLGPLKTFVVTVLQQIFFFVPGSRQLWSRYRLFSELGADEYATRGQAERGVLARAMYKMLNFQNNIASALPNFSSLLSERIAVLAGTTGSRPRASIIPAVIVFTIFMSAALGVLLLPRQILSAEQSGGVCHNVSAPETRQCRLVETVCRSTSPDAVCR